MSRETSGVSDRFELSPLGRVIWEDRYALKDEHGNIIEKSIYETFRRVAKAIASKEKNPAEWEEKFYRLMSESYLCPAGRILAHAGTSYSQLLNCFVLAFRDDSLEEIMHTVSDVAVVQKYGGGVGLNYSVLRPEGAHIKGVNGRSCGVIGFLSMASSVSEVIEQGGSRRAANLGLLDVSHPDVWDFIGYKANHNWEYLLKFIEVKDIDGWESFTFENSYKWQLYNVSVMINDDFLDALKTDSEWKFVWDGTEWKLYKVIYKKYVAENVFKEKVFEVTADDEKTALWKVRKRVPYPTAKDKFTIDSIRVAKASEIWDKICYSAWMDGCPGLINISTVRRMHNLEYIHPISATNPCGEQPLPAFGCCLLSSLILPSFVKNKAIDFRLLKDVITTTVRFMDDVIDNCDFPLPEIAEMERAERRIGLGTMGVHDMLIKLEQDYDSDSGRAVVEDVLRFIRDEAYKASIELAKEKGSFPVFNREKYLQSGFIKTLPKDIQSEICAYGIRNSCILSQAPTGTIGSMYNVSTGCEPWFALSFERNTRLGTYEDGCPAYLEWKKTDKGPKPSYFKTAHEITPEDHVRMMMLFSKYVDSAVSKTVNLPASASVADVKKVFSMAMYGGVKGITIFRDGSKAAVLKGKVVAEESCEDKTEKIKEIQKPKKRGNRTVGATTRVRMDNYNMYVTVNKNVEGYLVEIFATIGESKMLNTSHTSGVEDSWAEALGKTISLALRGGVDPRAIVRNLKNIPSDKPVFSVIGDCETAELIPSPPHAIARIIEEELKYKENLFLKTEDFGRRGCCSHCGSNQVMWKSSTCYRCLSCGTEDCSGCR